MGLFGVMAFLWPFQGSLWGHKTQSFCFFLFFTIFTKFAIMGESVGALGWIEAGTRLYQELFSFRGQWTHVKRPMEWRPDALKKILDEAIKTVNVLKSLPVSVHLFNILGEQAESVYKALLLLPTVQWLSWGKPLIQLFESGARLIAVFSFNTILTCKNNSISLIIFLEIQQFLVKICYVNMSWVYQCYF